MDERLEAYFLKIMKGQVVGLKAQFWKCVLSVLEKGFSIIIKSRNYLYRKLFFRKDYLGCIVISVGNLTVGGTGKTPVVEMLAKAFKRGGRNVAILSRGYKKKKKLWVTKFFNKQKYSLLTDVVSDGKQVLLNSRDAGDEPYMLARNLKGVRVLVDKNRVRSGSLAINEFSSDIILLDDGFQYLKLGRKHDILLIDSTNPFGYGRLLPRGILREHIKNMRRASLIFLTKTEKIDSTEQLRNEILEIHPKAIIIECYHEPKYFQDYHSGEQFPLEIIKNKKVSVFSGIAHPEGFEDTMKSIGSEIISFHRYRDHHRFKPREMRNVLLTARENEVDFIVTTEKDSVRLPQIDWKGKKLLFLKVEIRLVMGEEEFQNFILDICYN